MKKSRGLGDSIEKFTRSTGLKKIVEKVIPDGGCNCDKRRDTLNRIIPYKNKR